jgi:peptidoglycan/LPS O-acetylase OafA/YrhL
MTAGAPAAAAAPRFALFDSLRAIAALSVFAVHLPWVATLPAGNVLRPYLLQLNTGVAIFFLISGFLLYRPFVAARVLGTTAPAAGPYALRRSLRIVPAYWVALPFAVLLVGPSGEAATATRVFSPHGVVSYFGFLQVYDSDTLLGGISAAWSLCVEVTFYAMLPLWAFALGRIGARSRQAVVRSELVALAALFVAGLAWTTVAAASTHITPAVFLDVTQLKPWLWVLPAYLDHFALGMGLAVLSVVVAERAARPRALRLVERAPWVPWALSAVAFLAMGRLVRWFPDDWAARYVAAHVLQGVVALGLLLPAVFGDPERGWVRRLLANRALLWVGVVSYGLYLWHVAIMRELTDLGADDALGRAGFTVVALVLSLLAAAASFYLVERHALRLGRRVSPRRRSQDAEVRLADLGRHERPEAGVP